jgi:hypothetical protein
LREGTISNLELNKKVNPKSRKDVDACFQVRNTTVALEVKCPSEDKRAAFPGSITLHTAGRISNHKKQYQELKQAIESGESGTSLVLGKKPDHRMKECLVSAHEKFSPTPGVDDLNVLFLACGCYDRMTEWYDCLYGRHELFGPRPFHPSDSFSNVDVVILSSLRYRHEQANAFPAWNLVDVLLLPLVNPHGRRNRTTEAINEGLSVFNHCLKDFALFEKNKLIVDKDSERQSLTDETFKVIRFVKKHLTPAEFTRFFPVIVDLSEFRFLPDVTAAPLR